MEFYELLGGPAVTPGPGAATPATPVGFEPTRGDPIGLAGRRLNRSAKVSLRAISKHFDLCNPGSHACRLGKQPQREACAALKKT